MRNIFLSKDDIASLLLGLIGLFVFLSQPVNAQNDGSLLWFTQGELIPQNENLKPGGVCVFGNGSTIELAKKELLSGLAQLYNTQVKICNKVRKGDILLTLCENPDLKGRIRNDLIDSIGDEGFIIKYVPEDKMLIITGNTEISLLYGVFHYLRLLQTVDLSHKAIQVIEIPAYKKRILNHWDNLDGSVERGYAGKSIWKWDEIPQKMSLRYNEYARANASVGINGTVLNNVNANPEVLTTAYLKKVRAIANELRPYGMQVYLSVNFASPGVLGGLSDSSPKNTDVIKWWEQKVKEIYTLVPDFGGFLVKANSEGQPGPMDFGCTHADGANMLADALRPYNGVVMWRAFVYNPKGEDRAKQAYEEFKPLDGQFRENVMLQVKNGPVDFQPREPFSPLFGAMKQTSLMPEIQITQEYLGFSDHLVYLGSLYHEFLQSDTYAKGQYSTVAKVTDGRLHKTYLTGIAGVANIGSDRNWCGHHFAQSNWYVFGRLSWNPDRDVRTIAKDWIRQTLTQQSTAVDNIADIMMQSREAVVNYMTPLGLHHLMGWDHHYGPEPWCEVPGARPDWLPTYYHKADSFGIGFNRSSTGSNAVKQYSEPLQQLFNNPDLCPSKYLLWFHHLPWDYELGDGGILWDKLCLKYQEGVDKVHDFQQAWDAMEPYIDEQQFKEVRDKLIIQMREAIWWHDACLLYFQTFSNLPFPENIDQPIHKLEELKKQKFDLKHHN